MFPLSHEGNSYASGFHATCVLMHGLFPLNDTLGGVLILCICVYVWLSTQTHIYTVGERKEPCSLMPSQLSLSHWAKSTCRASQLMGIHSSMGQTPTASPSSPEDPPTLCSLMRPPSQEVASRLLCCGQRLPPLPLIGGRFPRAGSRAPLPPCPGVLTAPTTSRVCGD